MITVLICFIISFCIWWYIIKKDTPFGLKWTDYMGIILLSLVTGGLFGALGMVFIGTYFHDYGHSNTREIVSLNNQSTLSGSFILGSGTISNREYYFMFAKNSEGGFYRYTVPSNRSTIFEIDGSDSRVETFSPVMGDTLKWFAFPIGPSNYNIYVPKGTVIQQFSVQ
jgi:hypothetical protein